MIGVEKAEQYAIIEEDLKASKPVDMLTLFLFHIDRINKSIEKDPNTFKLNVTVLECMLSPHIDNKYKENILKIQKDRKTTQESIERMVRDAKAKRTKFDSDSARMNADFETAIKMYTELLLLASRSGYYPELSTDAFEIGERHNVMEQ